MSAYLLNIPTYESLENTARHTLNYLLPLFPILYTTCLLISHIYIQNKYYHDELGLKHDPKNTISNNNIYRSLLHPKYKTTLVYDFSLSVDTSKDTQCANVIIPDTMKTNNVRNKLFKLWLFFQWYKIEQSAKQMYQIMIFFVTRDKMTSLKWKQINEHAAVFLHTCTKHDCIILWHRYYPARQIQTSKHSIFF